MFAMTLKGGVATSLAPDVCKVPAPPAPPIPTPLVNIFQCNMADPSTACQKVFIDGSQALHFQTKVPLSNGDEAGVVGGVVSNRFIGPGSFSPAAASNRVMFEGKKALPMAGMTLHNGDASFNTNGLCPMAAQAVVMVGM
ncbi:MAG: DUF4150 domain-containing protein [Deltaproteobacteria bacterium]|jgi:hypothetical protein|nr:DUF4150 domain-containing protein [Deltaproteobacteria bacterium]